MENLIEAKVLDYDGKVLTVAPAHPIDRVLLQKQVGTIELRLIDGRTITAEQRKKIFAIIRDISIWSGHEPEYLRELLTWSFRSIDGREAFSLSDTDVTTAKLFINYLIEFCFNCGVPTKDTLLHRTDDIDRYLYLCLEHRKCAICNAYAEVHHVDRIGIGRDREKIVHVGLLAIALCRNHHEEAHVREKELFLENFVYGIKLDSYLCKKLNLNTKERK